MLKFIHLFMATSLVGLFSFRYLWLTMAMRNHERMLTLSVLRASFYFDVAFCGLILMLFFTGSLLTPLFHYTYQTPWIHAAFQLLTLVFIIDAILLFLNWRSYYRIKSERLIDVPSKIIFHLLSIITIALLLIIIHDAVTKTAYVVL